MKSARFLLVLFFLSWTTAVWAAEQQVVIQVSELNNQPRSEAVKKNLLQLNGVKAVAVDYTSEQATVTFDSGAVSEDQIRAAAQKA